MENSNGTHSEENNSELERFPNQSYDEIFITNTVKKVNNHALLR